MPCGPWGKAGSTLRSSRAVPHPSTNQALRRLTSEVGRDPVYSTRYGRQREMYPEMRHTFVRRCWLDKSPKPFLTSHGIMNLHNACKVQTVPMAPGTWKTIIESNVDSMISSRSFNYLNDWSFANHDTQQFYRRYGTHGIHTINCSSADTHERFWRADWALLETT